MTTIPQPSSDIACEKCGLKTILGTYYSFIYGYKAGYTKDVTYRSSTQIIKRTQYYKNLTESKGVYLCNKCVSLRDRRARVFFFRKAVIVVFALLIISIPLSIIMNDDVFLLPMLLLIFGVPIVIYEYLLLKAKEDAPMQTFSEKPFLFRGEILAIEVTKTSLGKSGVNAFFTHGDAKELEPVNR